MCQTTYLHPSQLAPIVVVLIEKNGYLSVGLNILHALELPGADAFWLPVDGSEQPLAIQRKDDRDDVRPASCIDRC